MGNNVTKIYKRVKSIFFFNKTNKQSSSFEKITELNKEINFHGNNRVHETTIGRNSYVSFNSIIYHTDIGNYCSIGPNVVVGFGDHPLDLISTSPHVYLNEAIFNKIETDKILLNHFEKVKIENDVWIGANVYIKNGVRIGNGAVVGAGSVVLKDVGDYEIVAGVPAKIIRKRFSDSTIELLLKSNWWNLNTETLKNYKDTLINPNEANLKDMIKKINSNE